MSAFCELFCQKILGLSPIQSIKEQVQAHLPESSEVQVLPDPMRRNAAPVSLMSRCGQGTKSQCPEGGDPVDHFVTEFVEFARIIALGRDFVKQYPALLAIGIKPSRRLFPNGESDGGSRGGDG